MSNAQTWSRVLEVFKHFQSMLGKWVSVSMAPKQKSRHVLQQHSDSMPSEWEQSWPPGKALPASKAELNQVPSSSGSNARGQGLHNAAGSQVSLAGSHRPSPESPARCAQAQPGVLKPSQMCPSPARCAQTQPGVLKPSLWAGAWRGSNIRQRIWNAVFV